jgi:4-hydroxy-tetrahydrodipicolinate reductase
MLNLILSGCSGYMGRVVTEMALSEADVCIVAGFDINTEVARNYPVFANPSDFEGCADVVVDFSSPAALSSLLAFALSRKIPLILCATGYSHEQVDAIKKASEQIPVFRSANMSVGINLLADLIKRACSVLGEDFDVEIIERHHRRKVDAPSGTALLLADAASSAMAHEAKYVFERESVRKPREKNEIGISAMRGGTIVGVHDVIFAGQDEVIELRHTAASRDVFAVGAIKAARFMADKPPGLYSMADVTAAIPFGGIFRQP